MSRLKFGFMSVSKLAQVGMLVICIWDISNFKFGRSTEDPDSGFSNLLCGSRQMHGWYLKLGHDHLIAHPFQSIIQYLPVI